MVAVISGNGLGLLNGSLSQLGLVSGAAGLGQGRDQQYVNTANGNLVIQGADAALVFNGVSLSDLRTYNSEGTGSDQGWLWGFSRRVYGLTGTTNTTGSTIKREAEDGSVLTYNYESATGLYRATGEAGTRDALKWDTSTARWTYTDADARRTETYNSTGVFTAANDLVTGGSYAMSYTSGRLTKVTSSDGDVLAFAYDAQGRVTSLSTTEVPPGGGNAVTRTAVSYAYDDQGRLSTVTTSLDSDSKASTDAFTSTYTYDGTSNRIASLTQGDGTSAAYEYTQGSDGTYRITRITTGAGSDASVQTLDYASVTEQDIALTATTITDANGQGWTYKSDAAGRLLSVVSPAVNGQRQTTTYTYDANNNVLSVTDALGNKTTYGYDTLGNRTSEQDALGDSVTRTFSTTNRLLTETTYRTATPGATPTSSSTPETVRYVYENDRVRFVIDAKGDVVENQYDSVGRLSMTRQFIGATYSTSGLALTASPTLTQMTTWAKARDLTQTVRTDFTYDVRGLVTSAQQYGSVDKSGAGVADASTSTTRYVFDAMGLLRQSSVVRGSGSDTTTYAYDGMGRLIGSASANGASSTWTYGADGSVVQVTVDPNGAAGNLVHTEFRNSRGDLVAVRDADVSGAQTRTTSYIYDAAGQLRATIHPDGAVDYTFYDAAGRVSMTVDAVGDVTEFVRDVDGRITSTTAYATPVDTTSWLASGAVVPSTAAAVRPATKALDRKSSVTYDKAGRIATSTDPAGLVTTNTYDGESNLVKTVAGSGTNARTTRYFYDAAGNLQGTLDADGYLTERVVDEAGRLIRSIGYATATVASTRASGTLAQLRPASSADDQASTYYYDGQGRTIGVLDGESYFTRYTYNETSRSTTATRYAAKLAGRSDSSWATLVGMTAGTEGQTLTTREDADGHVVSVTNAEGTETRSSYDAFGRLVSTTQAFGTSDQRTRSVTYDIFGDVVSTTDGEGKITRYTFDAAGRQTSRTDALGQTTWTVYDTIGRVRYTVTGEVGASGTLNAQGEVTAYTYDAFGDIATRTEYAGKVAVPAAGPGTIANVASALATIANKATDGTVHHVFDAAGRVVQTVDALGGSTTYTYDTFGQLTKTTRQVATGKTSSTTYAYDKRGNRLSIVEDTGGLARSSLSTYDAFGRVATETDGRGVVTVHEYDDLDREVGTQMGVDGDTRETLRRFDAFGRVLSVTDPAGHTTTYAYSDNSRTQTVTTPEGVVTVSTHNREGQTIAVANGAGTVATFSYDHEGRLVGGADANGAASSSEFDADGHLLRTTDAVGRVVAYSYDAAGRVLTRTVDPDGLALVTRYAYDGRGQEVSVTDPAGSTTTFAYDANGNLSSRTVDPNGLALRTSYTYDAQGRQLTVTSGVGTKDASTTRFVYDALGRVTQRIVDDKGLALVTSYTYDANDQIATSTDPAGTTTYFAYDEQGKLIFEVDPAGSQGAGMGSIIRYSYDADGLLVSTLTAGNLVSTSSLSGLAPASLDATRSAMSALFDSSTTAGAGTATYRVLDVDGRVRYTIDADGAVVEFRYNSLGQVSAQLAYQGVVEPGDDLAVALRDGRATATDVRSALDQIGQSDATASQQQFFYDANGRVRFSVTVDTLAGNTAGIVMETGYDAAGDAVVSIAHALTLTAAQLASGLDTASIAAKMAGDVQASVTTRVFDAAGRQVAVIGPGGAISYTFYDADGRVAGSVDGMGSLVTFTYDAAGRVVDSKAYSTALDTSAWLAGGKLTASLASIVPASGNYPNDDANRETTYAYDSIGRLVEQRTLIGTRGWKTYQVLTYGYDGASHLKTSTVTNDSASGTVASRTTTYYYDADGRVVATVDPMDYVRENIYDAAGRVVSTIAYASDAIRAVDKNGNWLPLSGVYAEVRPATTAADEVSHTFYDALGRVSGDVDAEGYYTRYLRDPTGQVLSSTRYATRGPAGTESDEAAVEAAVEAALAGTSARTNSASYDALGRVLTRTDEQGTVTTYAYDNRGHVTTTVSAAGTAEAHAGAASYDALGHMVSSTDALGRLTTYTYDAAGHLAKTVDSAGNATWFVNDASGHVLYSIRGMADSAGTPNSLGEVVANTYNAFGELASSTTYAQRVLITSLGDFAIAALTAAVTDIARPYQGSSAIAGATSWDSRTTFTYDKLGNLVETDAPSNVTHMYRYNAFGDLTYDVKPGGSRASGCGYGLDIASVSYYRYDADGRRIGSYEGVSADDYGWYTDVSDDIAFFGEEYWGNGSNGAYDGTASLVTLSERDAFGNVVRTTDGRGVVTEYAYDHLNRQVSRTDVMSVGSATSTTTYDAFRRIVSTTDALGDTTTYAYDDAGRTMIVRSPEGVTMTTGYNRTGHVIAVRDANGKGAVYQYSADGTLLSTSDALDGTSTVTYDAAGHAIEQVDAAGRHLRYTYDAVGRVLSRTVDPDGLDLITRYTYDAAGRMLTQTDPTGAVTAYGYDDASNQAVIVRDYGDQDHANLTTWYRFDTAGQVTAVTYGEQWNTSSRSYSYDAMGRLTSVRVGYETSHSYNYDQSGNLSFEVDGEQNAIEHVYDDANREIFTLVYPFGEGGYPAVTRRVFDAAGRLSSVTRYDDADGGSNSGALPQASSWNGQWQRRVGDVMADYAGVVLDAVPGTQKTSYVYDRDGRQRMEVSGGNVTETRYDDLGRVRETLAYNKSINPDDLTVDSVRSALADAGATEANARRTLSYYDDAGRIRFALKLGPAGGYVTESRYTADGEVASSRLYSLPIALAEVSDSSTTATIATLVAGTPYQGTNSFYDAAGRKVYEVDASGSVSEWRYDGAGRQTWELHWAHPISINDGATIADVQARLRAANPLDADAAGSGNTYNGAGQVSASYLSYGGLPASTYTYWENDGKLASKKDADGTVRTYAYNRHGELESETTHGVASADFDSEGGLVTTTGDLAIYYSYDNNGRLTQKNEGKWPTYVTTVYQYDFAGRVATTEISGHTSSSEGSTLPGAYLQSGARYDFIGNKTYDYDPNSGYTYHFYDNRGRPTFDVDPAGYVTGYDYDAYGDLTTTTRYATPVSTQDWYLSGTNYLSPDILTGSLQTSAEDRTLTITYDLYGNKIQVVQPPVAYTRADGSTSIGSPTMRFTYDAAGRVTSESVLVEGTPDTGAVWSTSFTFYDAAGRKVASVDALGYMTAWTYDNQGHVLSEVQSARAISTSSLVPGGAMPTAPAAGAADTGFDRVTTYTYTATGQVATETTLHSVSDGSGGNVRQASVVAYGYDSQGRVTTLTTNGRTVTTTYDAAGRVSSVTGPQERVLVADWQARLAADASLNIDSDALYQNAVESVSYGYDAFGNRTVETHSNSATGATVTTYHRYDAGGREIATLTPADGHTLDWTSSRVQTKAWDNNGNLLSTSYVLTDNEGLASKVIVSNTYDLDNRLLSTVTTRAGAAQPDASRNNSYNSFGETTATGALASSDTAAVFDAAGRLISGIDAKTGVGHTYTYDLAGNLLTDSYPAADGSGAITLHYVHDLDGRVTSRTVATTGVPATVTNTYDRWGNVLSGTDAKGNVAVYQYDEINHVLSESGPAVEVVGADGSKQTVATVTRTFYDLDGQVVGVTDANGYGTHTTFDAMGRAISVTDGAGATRNYAYDAMGNQVLEQDGLGNLTFRNVDVLGQVVQQGDFTIKDGVRSAVWRQAYVLDEAGNRLRVYDGTGSAFLQAGNLAAADRHANWYGYDSQGRVLWSQDIAQRAASVAQADGAGASSWSTTPFNPGFGQGGTGWTADPDFQFNGSAAVYNSATTAVGTIVNNDRVPVDPGQVINAHATVQVTGTQGSGAVFILWYNAAGQVIGQSDDTVGVQVGQGSAVSSVSGTAPAGAASAAIGITANNASDTANTVSIDSVAWDYAPPASAGAGSNGGVVVTLPTGSFTMQPTNPDFEKGPVGWALNGAWSIRKGYDYAGSGWAAQLTNSGGALQEIVNDDQVPVQPGLQITAKAMVQQGASSSGKSGAEVRIIWYNAAGDRIGDATGNLINSGSNGRWGQSTVTATAPADAAFARVAIYGYNESNDELFVDAVSWDYQFLVPADPKPVLTSYTYDVYGNRTSETTADGDTQTWNYDAYGHVTAHTDLSGATYNYTYDAQAHVLTGASDTWAGQTGVAPTWVTGSLNVADSSTRTYYANGLVKSITYADGSVYSYQYDNNGNVTREESLTHDATNVQIHVVTETAYDSHNRISHVTTTNLAAGTQLLDLYYRYDAVGNRREISGTSGSTSQDAWYTYDGDNRVLISAGQLTGGAIYVANNATSYALSYDAVGNAVTRTTMSGGHVMVQASKYDSRGQLIEADYAVDVTANGAFRGVEEKRSYDENGKVVSIIQFYALGTTIDGRPTGKTDPDGVPIVRPGTDVGGKLASATFDRYDAYGRLLEEQNFGHASSWTGSGASADVPAGMPAADATSFGSLTLQSSVTYKGPHGSAGYDAVGNVVYYQQRTSTSQVNQYTVTYLRKDGYLEAATSGQNISGSKNVVPVTDQSVYDRRGNRVAIVQHTQYAGGSSVVDTLRSFAYDGNGEIISRRDGTDKNGAFDQGTNPATQNQHYMYVGGYQVGHTDEAGKLDVLTQVTAFSSGPSNGYVVQAGDTLRSIAQAVYGNASLWYVIAQANAIDSDAGLAVGQDLTIPEIKTNQNDATTFKPYNPSEIAGSTTPTLPTIAPPPPPPSRGHCNVVATIVVIAVAVAASFIVGPVAGAALSSSLGGAAVGAAAGSAAGQLTGDALGTHQGFSLGEVFTAAATGAVSAGVSNYFQSGTVDTAVSTSATSGTVAGNTASSLTFGERALQSAAGYVGQDVAGKLVGQQEHFSWAGLLASSVASGVGGEFGPTQAQVRAGQLGTSAFNVGVASAVEGTVQRGVSQALGDRRVDSWESIAETAVGSGVGAYAGLSFPTSYAERIAASREQARGSAARSSGIMQLSDSALASAIDPGYGYSLASAGPGVAPSFQFRSQVNRGPDGQMTSGALVANLEGIEVRAAVGSSLFDVTSLSITSKAAVRSLTNGDVASGQRSTPISLSNPGSINLPGVGYRSSERTTADPAQAVTLAAIHVTSDGMPVSQAGYAFGNNSYNDYLGTAVRAAGAVAGVGEAVADTALGIAGLAANFLGGVGEDLVGTRGISDRLLGARTTVFDGSAARFSAAGEAIVNFARHPVDGLTQHVEGLNAQLQTAADLAGSASYGDQFASGLGFGHVTASVASDVLAAGGAALTAGRLGSVAARSAATGAGLVGEALSTFEYSSGAGGTFNVGGEKYRLQSFVYLDLSPGRLNSGIPLETRYPVRPVVDVSANTLATSSVVNLQLKYKPTWTAVQRAEADAKVTALSEAETVVTVVNRSGTSASSRYRATGGVVPAGYDVDHTVDLQLGGADSVLNMLPLNSSVNRSLGSQIQWRIRELPAGTIVGRVTIGE